MAYVFMFASSETNIGATAGFCNLVGRQALALNCIPSTSILSLLQTANPHHEEQIPICDEVAMPTGASCEWTFEHLDEPVTD